MYLSKIRLWNFRKFGSEDNLIDPEEKTELRTPDLEINFNKKINVLIGENDAGKTAIIDAIKIILKTHAPEWIQLKKEDFFTGTNNLRIECQFDELSTEEARHFIEWLGFEDESKIPYLKINIQAKKNEEKIFFHDIKAGADSEGASLSGEAKEYLKTVYLKPLRDAKTELIPKKNSRLSQVLQGHETFKGQQYNHKLVDIFKDLESEINKYFENDTDGKKPKEGVDKILKTFFKEEKKIQFSITNKREIKEILEILKIALDDEKMGLGSHNLLFMATELLNLKRTDWDGIRLGLIEELEAHLHPQAQMRVIESLKKESEENNVQFILTTHSPNIGSKVSLDNLFICEDKNVFSMKKTIFFEDREKNKKGEEMKKTDIKELGETKLDNSDYKFLERFLDITKANMFFANGVILVEGWTEEIIIPVLAKKIGIDLTQKGVSVVNVAGTAFLRYAKIFQRRDEERQMKIPVSIVTDSDIYPGMEEENKNQYDKQVAGNNTVKGYAGQSIKVFISNDEDWTLEWVLYKSSVLGGLFKESIKEVHPKTSEFKTDEQFSEKLTKKLKDKNEKLKKVDIANVFAQKLEESEIDLTKVEDKNIKYLLDAIKYASGEKITEIFNPK